MRFKAESETSLKEQFKRLATENPSLYIMLWAADGIARERFGIDICITSITGNEAVSLIEEIKEAVEEFGGINDKL